MMSQYIRGKWNENTEGTKTTQISCSYHKYAACFQMKQHWCCPGVTAHPGEQQPPKHNSSALRTAEEKQSNKRKQTSLALRFTVSYSEADAKTFFKAQFSSSAATTQGTWFCHWECSNWQEGGCYADEPVIWICLKPINIRKWILSGL